MILAPVARDHHHNHHRSFGARPHRCVGSDHARCEGRVATELRNDRDSASSSSKPMSARPMGSTVLLPSRPDSGSPMRLDPGMTPHADKEACCVYGRPYVTLPALFARDDTGRHHMGNVGIDVPVRPGGIALHVVVESFANAVRIAAP